MNLERERTVMRAAGWRPKMKIGCRFCVGGGRGQWGAGVGRRGWCVRLYYVGLAPYERARIFLGLRRGGWVMTTGRGNSQAVRGGDLEGDVSAAAEVF